LYYKNYFQIRTNIKFIISSVKGKEFVAHKIIELLNFYPDIIISAISFYKENVEQHIQSDSNILYNYMLSLSLHDLDYFNYGLRTS